MAKTETLTWQAVRQLIIDTMKDRNLPKTKAHQELGVARATLYAWIGAHSSVPPMPDHAAAIAKFIEKDPFEVRVALLRAHGYLDNDEYIAVRSKAASDRLRRRSTGAIPGYVSSPAQAVRHHRVNGGSRVLAPVASAAA